MEEKFYLLHWKEEDSGKADFIRLYRYESRANEDCDLLNAENSNREYYVDELTVFNGRADGE